MVGSTARGRGLCAEDRPDNLLHMPPVIEFWPEYDGGPLWNGDGESIDLDSLPLSDNLRSRLLDWNARYDDLKLPFESRDEVWLAEGKSLLAETRAALGTVITTEPWWGELPSE